MGNCFFVIPALVLACQGSVGNVKKDAGQASMTNRSGFMMEVIPLLKRALCSLEDIEIYLFLQQV